MDGADAPAPRRAVTRTGYRPEIDGLRGLAVLAVILFHAGVPWLGGGYLGVDIFFVISGYLITGLILRGQAEGGFSLRRFYLRRIRRILPALLLTMALATPFALAFMLPDQLQNFGQSLVATAAMANNVLLLATGGYWAAPAEFKPLMHTWSLGVEEQFYLLLPPLMALLLRRAGPRALVWALALAGLASLALAHYWSQAAPRIDFVLLPSRVGELAAGGLVAAFEHERGRPAGRASESLAWVGLALMLASLALFGAADAPPSLRTAIPVLGCALFLAAARAGRGVGRWLALPLAGIGLISYSAYLFHQPVFGFVRLMSWREPGPLLLIALVPPILAAAWASWRWLERPARDRAKVSDRAILLACAAASLVLVAIGLVLHHTDGFAYRWAELRGPGGAEPIDNIAYVDRNLAFAGRRLDSRQRLANVLFIGDSRARDAINMALETGTVGDAHITYVQTDQCGPELVRQSLTLAPAVDTAILAITPDPALFACYREWIARLGSAGVGHVVVLGPKQFGWSLNPAMYLPPERRVTLRLQPVPGANESNRASRDAVRGSSFIDLMGLIADERDRVPVFTPDGRLVSQDRLHLTPAGAQWLGRMLFAQPQLAHLRDLAEAAN